MPPLSAIDTHVILVIHPPRCCTRRRCTRRSLPPPHHRHDRRHNRRYGCRYRCRILVKCCTWDPPLPLVPLTHRSMTLSPSLLFAAAADTTTVSATTAISATMIAATFWLFVVCGTPPFPLPRASRRSMTLSSQCGSWRRTTPIPAEQMPGGHRVVAALLHRRPSPLWATAHSLRPRRHRCHRHSPRWRENDRRRRR